jgi:hypothetical protein
LNIFLATIQCLSKTRAFLLEKRSECYFVWAAPSLLLTRTFFIIALFEFQLAIKSGSCKSQRKRCEVLPARRLSSSNTKKIYPLSKRITDTPSSGVVVTPDWFGETALGSRHNPPKEYCLTLYSSSILSMLKIFIFFF